MTAALLALAFTAGALAFAAPCALPLLPGYVAYFVGASGDGTAGPTAATDGAGTGTATTDPTTAGGGTESWFLRGIDQHGPSLPQATVVAGVTGLGATVVFAVFAVLVAVVGAGIAQFAGELELLVGALVAIAGVLLATGVAKGMVSVQLAERSRSPAGFFTFGVTYGLAASGCTAPVFVGISLAGASRGPFIGATVVGAYAFGLVLALTVLTLAAALGHSALLSRIGRGTGRIVKIAGVLLIIAGIAQMHYAITVAGALG